MATFGINFLTIPRFVPSHKIPVGKIEMILLGMFSNVTHIYFWRGITVSILFVPDCWASSSADFKMIHSTEMTTRGMFLILTVEQFYFKNIFSRFGGNGQLGLTERFSLRTRPKKMPIFLLEGQIISGGKFRKMCVWGEFELPAIFLDGFLLNDCRTGHLVAVRFRLEPKVRLI